MMKHDFDFLLTIFDSLDVAWLKSHTKSELAYLYARCYNPVSLSNIRTMLDMGFQSRTILSLWMTYPDAFNADEAVFKERLEELAEYCIIHCLDKFYWKYGEISALGYIAVKEASEWKAGLKQLREELRVDRRNSILKKLVQTGFKTEDVENVLETNVDFVLEVIADYYLEAKILNKLRFMLKAGFQETLLLQLFVDNPGRFAADEEDELGDWYLENEDNY